MRMSNENRNYGYGNHGSSYGSGYGSGGYGRSRESRYENRLRYAEGRRRYEPRDDESRYENNVNAPLEWDSRRYGRDFNDDFEEGGRYIRDERYGSDERSGDPYRMSQQSRPQHGQRYGQQYSQQYGPQNDERAGYSNYGSNRYGGSDYGNDDYDYSESRYSSPYMEASSNRVVGSNWSRTAGTGEWYSGGTQRPYRSEGGRYSQSDYQRQGNQSSYRGRDRRVSRVPTSD
jgi:hypothetical protein